MNDRVYFANNDGAAGIELWQTDGTVTGTRRVADVCPGACSSYPVLLTSHAAGLFFFAEDPTPGFEPRWLAP